MLVYKYHDVFSTLRYKQRCAECENITKCYWHKYKKNPGMVSCGDARFVYKNPEVQPSNANWLLFQIGRDIELSKNVIIQRNNNLRIAFTSPESMRTNHLPNIDESKIYINILDEFSKVIVKFEKDIKGQREDKAMSIRHQRELVDVETDGRKKMQLESRLRKLEADLLSIDSDIGRFVGSIIETTLKVDGKEISIFSDGEDLVDAAKDVAQHCGYTLVRQKDYKEARLWLGQITSVS